MSAVGADGCRGGWCFFRLRHGRYEFGVAPTFAELLTRTEPTRLLIDIPIGLKEDGGSERRCDNAARRLLGARASSVFPVPCRAAVFMQDYQDANRTNRERTGRGLSRQSFAIAPKIAEVDTALRHDLEARRVVHETHPELLFWGLAGSRPMRHGKKTPEGVQERLDLLARHAPAAKLLEAALAAFPRKLVARDDVLDTLVACVVAAMAPSELLGLPAPPEFDEHGLRMEIVYWQETNGGFPTHEDQAANPIRVS